MSKASRTRVPLAALTALAAMALPLPPPCAAADPALLQADDDCVAPRISSRGNVVAFHSGASNVVPADRNGRVDIFVRDLETRETTRVSVRSDGTEADGDSTLAAVSADGRWIAFASEATNLVEGDTNGVTDVFVHDRRDGRTIRVSAGSRGRQADGASRDAAISADGRHVAFSSTATNLVSGDANAAGDVFVHDLRTGRTRLVSCTPSGAPGDAGSWAPSISADGRRIAFLSHATNLAAGGGTGPRVLVRDQRVRRTTLASVSTPGVPANAACERPVLSADGRRLAFTSWATNLAAGDGGDQSDVFVRDLETGTTTLASAAAPPPAVRHARQPALSADGERVAFETLTTESGPSIGDSVIEVIVVDTRTGSAQRASVEPDGKPAGRDSAEASLSADGRLIAFASKSPKLVPDDANRKVDVFVRDLDAGTTVLASVPAPASAAERQPPTNAGSAGPTRRARLPR